VKTVTGNKCSSQHIREYLKTAKLSYKQNSYLYINTIIQSNSADTAAEL